MKPAATPSRFVQPLLPAAADPNIIVIDGTRYRRATAVKNINVAAEQGRQVRGESLHEDQLDV